MGYCKTIGDGCILYTQKTKEETCTLTEIVFTEKIENFVFPNKDHLGRTITEWSNDLNVEFEGRVCWPDTITIPNTVSYVGFVGKLKCQTLIMNNKCGIIYPYQFENNKDLRRIVLPKTTTIIDLGAFRCCGNKDEPCHIVIPDTCTTVGKTCFCDSSLNYLRWPKKAKRIPNSCFLGAAIECLDLSEAEILGIGEAAFVGTRIGELRLPYYPINGDRLRWALKNAQIGQIV